MALPCTLQATLAACICRSGKYAMQGRSVLLSHVAARTHSDHAELLHPHFVQKLATASIYWTLTFPAGSESVALFRINRSAAAEGIRWQGGYTAAEVVFAGWHKVLLASMLTLHSTAVVRSMWCTWYGVARGSEQHECSCCRPRAARGWVQQLACSRRFSLVLLALEWERASPRSVQCIAQFVDAVAGMQL
jgi:hypothetical protein